MLQAGSFTDETIVRPTTNAWQEADPARSDVRQECNRVEDSLFESDLCMAGKNNVKLGNLTIFATMKSDKILRIEYC